MSSGNINYCLLNSLIIRLVRLSSLAFCKLITAHTAAGIQPISIACNSKQIIPVMILPRKKKDKAGNRMAMSVMCLQIY